MREISVAGKERQRRLSWSGEGAVSAIARECPQKGANGGAILVARDRDKPLSQTRRLPDIQHHPRVCDIERTDSER